MEIITDQNKEIYKSKLLSFKNTKNVKTSLRHVKSWSSFIKINDQDREFNEEHLLTEIEEMKERFSKLLLGEDIFGGGKGVSSALALSNAITDLASSAFGEQLRLEPISNDLKLRWKREIKWFLSVTDHIVQFSPTQQTNKDGFSMEVMTTTQRTDLVKNIPTLKNLDLMLLDSLDKFNDQDEFNYIKPESPDSENGQEVKIQCKGLSETSKRFLLSQKECLKQVLKTAMAINSQALSEMEIPESYLDSLPKNGRDILGDMIYKMITADMFDADQFLLELDLTSEHKVLELKNKIEASITIWKRKMVQKDTKSPWISPLSIEKRQEIEERAEAILFLVKQSFPGTSQSTLDINKIQFNKDVGLAILESYSRVLENLAHKMISRIEEVLYADQLTQDPSIAVCKRYIVKESENLKKEESFGINTEEMNEIKQEQTPTSLCEIMQWDIDVEKDEPIKRDSGKKLLRRVSGIIMANNKKSSCIGNTRNQTTP